MNLGSATGWKRGHRHALSRLRLARPDKARAQTQVPIVVSTPDIRCKLQVHAGLSDNGAKWCAQYEDVSADELQNYLLPAAGMEQQVTAGIQCNASSFFLKIVLLS